MLLADLLHGMEYELLLGSTETEITGITDHSAQVKPGSMFVCIEGYHTDGHDYINEAVAAGASCIVIKKNSCAAAADLSPFYQSRQCSSGDEMPTVIRVRDTAKALALLAASFYGGAAERLTMIGITGTKGKTTTACMLTAILRQAGLACGMIGTLGAWYDELLETPVTTTPDALTLHRLLAEMEKKGCTHVVLEVSSQSLMRRRVYGIFFDLSIYTNLYPDHIGPGEHNSAEEYAYWKSTLFAHSKVSVINEYAKGAGLMTNMAAGSVTTYSLNNDAGDSGHHKTEQSKPYCSIDIDIINHLSLPGAFNRENALAAMTAAQALGIDKAAFQVLKTLWIPGRTEVIDGGGYQVVIDYAHNESSMEKLLTALRDMKPKRLICIYGSGGSRSTLRRVGMGRAGGKLADLSVLTEDNSRTEPLEQILAGLIEGVTSVQGRYRVIPDRKEAIHQTIREARAGDLIAVIGKGHEQYQEIGTVRVPFSDRDEVMGAMALY